MRFILFLFIPLSFGFCADQLSVKTTHIRFLKIPPFKFHPKNQDITPQDTDVLAKHFDILQASKSSNLNLFPNVNLPESEVFKEEIEMMKFTASLYPFNVLGSEEVFQQLNHFVKSNKTKPKLSITHQVKQGVFSKKILIELFKNSYISFLKEKYNLDTFPSSVGTYFENTTNKVSEDEILETYQNNLDSLKQQTKDMHYTIADSYAFFTEDDFKNALSLFFENPDVGIKDCLQLYMEQSLTKTKNYFSEKTIEIYKSIKNEDINILNKYAFGPAHIVLWSYKPERAESIETYLKTLADFEKKLLERNLKINEKIKKSLLSLKDESDKHLRGFYTDVIESNTSEEDFPLLVHAFNEIEGCEDCARIFAYHLWGLNKQEKNKDFFMPYSLEDLYEKLHQDLFVKRAEVFKKVFEEKIAKAHGWSLISEKSIYVFGKLRSFFQDLFGLGKVSYTKTTYYSDSADPYTRGDKKPMLIEEFYTRYTKDVVLNIFQKRLNKNYEYHRSLLNFIGKEENLNKNSEILPKYSEEDLTQSTLYCHSNGKATLSAQERILELFGFNKIVN